MKKSKVVTFSLDDASLEDLDRLCEALGMSKSEFIRSMIRFASNRLESGNLTVSKRGEIVTD